MDKWLKLAMEIQSLAQNGLTYSNNVFDTERYERLRRISAEMISIHTELSAEKVQNLFCNETGYQTPKLDTRAAIFKNNQILLVHENNGTWSLPGGRFAANSETTETEYFSLDELPLLAEEKNTKAQIEMCFAAAQDETWQVRFD